MLISWDVVKKIISDNNINISGVLHLGAHDCEEINFYNFIGLKNEDLVWIDAINSKVIEAIKKGIPNVYHAVITDKDDDDVVFNVSNNGQSSSVLDFGTHSKEHPYVVYVDKITQKSVTIDTFMERNNINSSKYNFWNFDIQGAELLALKGSVKAIKDAKILYLEVNQNELYKNGALIGEIDSFLSKYNFERNI
jgi:hypothetical protein